MASPVRPRAVALLAAAAALSGLAFVAPHNGPGSSQRADALHAAAVRNSRPVRAEAAETAVQPSAQASSASGAGALRAAVALLAALVVAFVPMDGAEAAMRGGRMGGGRMGGGMGRRAAPPPRAPRSSVPFGGGRSGPNISLGVGPMFAPRFFGPPIFAPPVFGPPILPVPVPVPVPSGPSVSDQMLKDQQFRDERTIDQQTSQIQELQKEIQDLKAKKN
mmetsp:Transcript_81764/g.210556  ORF Transcript_81764/g.210556 Transcript_81764/m.210556 type:complete len:220 (-) Transcript_81764:228-887(-)